MRNYFSKAAIMFFVTFMILSLASCAVYGQKELGNLGSAEDENIYMNQGLEEELEVIHMSGLPVIKFTVEAMARDAQYIVRAEILDERMELRNRTTQEVVERYYRDGTSARTVLPFTVNRIRVIEVLRGNVEAGDIMEIIRMGGRAGNMELIMRNEMDIPVGVDVVLFLTPEGYRVGAYQGIYRFPYPTNRLLADLDDDQVLEGFSEYDDLFIVTAGILREIANTPITLRIAQSEWEVPAEGAEIYIYVTVNQPWRESSSADWLRAVWRGSLVELIAEENPSYSERTAEVTIRAGELMGTITVTQAGRIPLTLEVEPLYIEVYAGESAQLNAKVNGTS